MVTCAFTGYRPEKMPYNEEHPACDSLKRHIRQEALRLIKDGVTVFISGMARGVDIWAAEIVLELKQSMPERSIELWAAVPYEGQADSWQIAEQTRYQRILAAADRVECICRKYERDCFFVRNRYMVDHAAHLIAVYDGKSGGTQYTIKYAIQKGLQITIISP